MDQYHVTLFDGVCDQTKELQTLSGCNFCGNYIKWIISSSGGYMFVRFAVSYYFSTGFLAKIHYGNEILNQKLVHTNKKIPHLKLANIAVKCRLKFDFTF